EFQLQQRPQLAGKTAGWKNRHGKTAMEKQPCPPRPCCQSPPEPPQPPGSGKAPGTARGGSGTGDRPLCQGPVPGGDIASNRRELLQLRITHVLNASHCRWRGGADYYEGTGIRYLGIEAHDSPSFDMSPYFYPAADFIHQALNEGRILVHCAVGVSRSATLVLAYLMIRHHMPLVEAIKTVKDHRGIIPNRGFLRQLVALDNALRLQRSS
uniref:Dual specificity protein phosphatase n=2 Tax=Passeriformes TaxID=9126 RepID=A0A8C5IGI2_JUNHY